MRLLLVSLTVMAVFFTDSLLAESGQVRMVNVLKDKNVVVKGGPYIEHYWIETDGTQGVIYLTFPEIDPSLGAPRSLSLIINIPSIKDSGSGTGCDVLYNGAVVGQLPKGNPGSWEEIHLKNMTLKKGKVELTIKPRGEDGMAVCSRASGFGPILKVVY